MAKKRSPRFCNVVVKDGQQLLTMPDGTYIPCVVFTRVTDIMEQTPYAIVKLYVNLIESPLDVPTPKYSPSVEEFISLCYHHHTREELIDMVARQYGKTKGEASTIISNTTT